MDEPCVDVKNRFGSCEVCNSEGAQYKCPRCEVKTCSLDCVKNHKENSDCSGVRNKTVYVPLKKFTNLNVLSDYRLLEDITRVVDVCRRNPLKKHTRHKRSLPVHLFRLKSAATQRKTSLQYLPNHFSRHQENTSYLDYGTKIIYWKVQFVFPQAENIKIMEEKCDENERLSSIIAKYVEVETCPELYRNHLRFYHSVGVSGLEVLLKAENVKGSSSFFILDKFSSLKENFENKLLIEYPVIYVILQQYKDEYHVFDPDLKFECEPDIGNSGKTALAHFTPYNFYDTISYVKADKNVEGSKAVSSIHSYGQELRKFFGVHCESAEEEPDEDETKLIPTGVLTIPDYHDL